MNLTRAHWDKVYTEKSPTEVSWYQEHCALSLGLIERASASRETAIIDVGGGASSLVDDLLDARYEEMTVLDLSGEALQAARERLGDRAGRVSWIEADITEVELPEGQFDVWHDRAVFHFLTEKEDRARYVEAVRRAVRPGGHVIVATFGPEGPHRCSGLPVVRYGPERLHAEFGAPFLLVDHASEEHRTPFGTVQQFIYCFCRLLDPS
jgi:SAM-dependent methyltransferase